MIVARTMFVLALLSVVFSAEPIPIKLIHTSDVHSHIDSMTTKVVTPEGKVVVEYGGYPRLSSILSKEKNTCSLIVDSGDQFFGSIYFSYLGTNPLKTMMAFMNYDVLSLGNHEFDLGIDMLVDFINSVKKEYVCTTLDFSATPLEGKIKRSVIKTLTGCGPEGKTVRVGILGAIDKTIINQKAFNDGLIGLDVVEEINKEAAALKSGDNPVDMVLVLSHMGVDVDYNRAEKMQNVDIILGGHTHILLTERTSFGSLANNLSDLHYDGFKSQAAGPFPIAVPTGKSSPSYVILAHSGCYGEHVGHLTVYLNQDTKQIEAEMTLKSTKEVTSDPASYNADSALSPYNNPLPTEGYIVVDQKAENERLKIFELVESQLQLTLATTDYDLIGNKTICSEQETNVGDIVADAYRLAEDNVNFAVINAGGIRGGAKAPEIKYADVYTMLPYGNEVYSCQVPGKILKNIFEAGLADTADTAAGSERTNFLQFSGALVDYDMTRPDGDRVVSIMLCKNPTTMATDAKKRLDLCNPKKRSHWTKVDGEKTYKLVASSFLLEGNDGQTDLKNSAKSKAGIGNENDLVTNLMGEIGHFTMEENGDGRHGKLPVDAGLIAGCTVAAVVVVIGIVLGVVFGLKCKNKNKNKKGEDAVDKAEIRVEEPEKVEVN